MAEQTTLLEKDKPAPLKAGIHKRWRSIVESLQPLGRNGYIWLITIGAVVAAQATLIWAPKVGVYINAIALAGLTAVAISRPAARKVAISMGIIPVANMITLSTTTHTLIGQTIIFYSALLLLGIVYRLIFTLEYPLKYTKLSGKGYGLALPLMIIIGQIVGLIGYGFLRHQYPYSGYSLPLITLVVIAFAFTEEIVLRGLIQQQGSTVFHPLAAALASTVLYVFLSLDHRTMLAIPAAIIMGGVLSFTYYKKQNLLLTTTINAAAKLTYIGLVSAFILR